MNWFSRIFQKNNDEDVRASKNNDTITCQFERYDQTNTDAMVDLLCEGYRLKGQFTLNEISDFIRNTRAEHPDHVLFATLDDVWQAAYTCGHSTDKHELDDTKGHNLSDLPSTAFEEYEGKVEHIGYLTLTREFPIRHSNFMEKATKSTIADLAGNLWWEMSDYFKPIMTNDDVSSLVRENNCFVQIVPVAKSPEALAAYPNGYFSDDLDPFQNFALAKYMLDNFGFELFGVGATYVGFMRDNVLTGEEADKIGLFLEGLFDGYKGRSPLRNIISTRLAGTREFYIAYGGS